MFVESWTSFVWARQRPPNVLRGLWGGEGMVAPRGGFPRAWLARRLDFCCHLHRLAFTALSARMLLRGLAYAILLIKGLRIKSLFLLLQLSYYVKACSGR